jgi:Thioredoxin-like/Disulphide bond corrector protein DsbC
MRLFSEVSACARFFVLCAAVITSPLYATNLNPVAWSLNAEQQKVAPGAVVALRLHAQIAAGYHLYSFTTPAGGPIKATASLHANPDIKDLRVYQPKPDRHQDPTLNVPVETFQRGVDFVVSGGCAPAVGMVAFAGGLATPFLLFALFPSYVRKLPRSGAWLEPTKPVAGFVVLAAMFKYLANIDEVWHWGLLSRERVLAIWFALLLTASLYLMGQFRLRVAEGQGGLSLIRALAGIALLAFTVSLLPGLWGKKLGGLEAFLPSVDETAFAPGVTDASSPGPIWRKDDYDEALAEAKQENKPLLIAFSGYACTNCHWMKTNIFPKPEVSLALRNYVLVELYTDGTDSVSARYQKFEQDRFKTVALPYCVITDTDGHQLGEQEGLTRDANQFASFLHTGLAAMQSQKPSQLAGPV